MQTIISSTGLTVSYDEYGDGPPLVLVHGAFSDHVTNWEFVKPMLESRFRVYALARRGRGETPATEGHSLIDEVVDLTSLLRTIDRPVILLGHSYGAHLALHAAREYPELVRKLVLYEPPWPGLLSERSTQALDELARSGDWDAYAWTFFKDVLDVPVADLEALRASDLWPPIVGDAKASSEDLRAVREYEFQAERFRGLRMPVLLQIGSESPRYSYVTDELVEVFADARIDTLEGQAHEGMTTAPDQYAHSVIRFCLDAVDLKTRLPRAVAT